MAKCRPFGTIAGVAALALSAAGCSGGATSGGSRGSTAAGTPLVSFVPSPAAVANGSIPRGTAAGTCGSPRYGWVSELAHVSVTQARVTRHWAAFIRTDGGLAAKQMEASGSIADINVGAVDVPFDHPFGGDMSFDEHLDPVYAPLSQNLGENSGGNSSGVIHDELMTGLIPHVGEPRPAPGLSWPAFAASTSQDIESGFMPQRGDRVAVMGSWVVDCGHTDFHSELHSVTFMAFGHRLGMTTVAHAFYNPYEVAQVFNPDPSLSGRVTDPAVLTASSTQDLPHYLISELLRLATGKDSQPRAPVVLEANTQSPTPWSVCAPPGTGGSRLAISYSFSVRPGVTISVATNARTGCAVVTVRLTPAYRPVDASGEFLCPTDWNWLSEHAFSEASTFGGTGGVPHSIPQVILDQIRSILPGLVPAVSRKLFKPVLSACYPPLAARDLGTPRSGVETVTTSASQSTPFAGWVDVGWAK